MFDMLRRITEGNYVTDVLYTKKAHGVYRTQDGRNACKEQDGMG